MYPSSLSNLSLCALTVLLYVSMILAPVEAAFPNEQPCWGQGGQCIISSKCRSASFRKTGWCPSQSANIKCCLPYPESGCNDAGGSCRRSDTGCPGGAFKSKLCPSQPANVRCCIPTKTTVDGDCAGSACSKEIPIPPEAKSQRYSSVPASSMLAHFGAPCSRSSSKIVSSKLAKVMATKDLGPFRSYGMAPFLDALTAAFANLKREKPGVFATISNGGTYNCRYVGKSNTWSNHAYGAAIDLKLNGNYDPYNNRKVFAGLKVIHPYMAAQGLFWGAGYQKSEDGMHFEVSTELFNKWKSEGKI